MPQQRWLGPLIPRVFTGDGGGVGEGGGANGSIVANAAFYGRRNSDSDIGDSEGGGGIRCGRESSSSSSSGSGSGEVTSGSASAGVPAAR